MSTNPRLDNPYASCEQCDYSVASRDEHARIVVALTTPGSPLFSLDRIDVVPYDLHVLVHGHLLPVLHEDDLTGLDEMTVRDLARALLGFIEETLPDYLADCEQDEEIVIRWGDQATAIHPQFCSCTECIIGASIPLSNATHDQVLSMLRGELANATHGDSAVLRQAEIRTFGRSFSYAEIGDLPLLELRDGLKP